MQRLYSLFQCSAACAGYEPVPKVICGIGAMLEPNSSDELVVADLVPGGPAELSGLLEVGDVLHEVDGVDVYKRPAKEVGEFIRGEVGTTICLGLAKKKCGSNTVYIEQVELTRGEATLPDKKRTTNKQVIWDRTPTVKETKDNSEAGIGAALGPNNEGNLEFTELVPGGPADTSGAVDVGDVLHEVDGINILGKPVPEVAPMIRGEAGTSVCLAIAKDGDEDRMEFPVLIRDNPEPVKRVTNLAAKAQKPYVSFE